MSGDGVSWNDRIGLTGRLAETIQVRLGSVQMRDDGDPAYRIGGLAAV
jgi:hypothetical protein